ncbi:hypothetical protein ISCGN_003801 [Ixodes scapularis]
MAPKFVQGQDGWHHAVSQVQATLVLRPSDHLNLTKHDPCQIHTALRTQAALAPADASKFMVRVDKSKNLAFLLCLDSHVTQPLQEITSVDLEDRRCGVTIYPATPSNTCKGVIHNIPAGTSPEYLMRHMSTLRPEFKILAARMMGRTTTALITFHGTHIPHEICYAGGIFRCRPHRPKAQYCHRCQQIGHRIDVCTYNARCPTCGQLKPDDDSHTCSADPVCLRCGGPHRADDAACKDKQAADAAVRQLAYNKRIAQRKAALKAEGVAAAASATAPPKAPSGARSRSRSRTRFTTPSRRSRSRTRFTTPSPRRTSSSPRRTHTSSGRSPAGTRGHSPTAHQTPSRLPSHQWNCRGFKSKRNSFFLWLQSQPQLPDILLLQETGLNPTLSGYVTFQQTPCLATLVRSTLTATHEHDTANSLTVSIPLKRGSLHISNVYSPPRNTLPELNELLHPCRAKRRFHHILAGDFNAPHPAWGYTRVDKKGRRVHCALQEAGYTLHNDIHEHTRMGNSVERNTNPDLTFSTPSLHLQWEHTQEYMGSDHAILHLTVSETPRRIRWKPIRIIDWHNYRQDRSDPPFTDIPTWTQQLTHALDQRTKILATNEIKPHIDTHLAHSWEARASLLKRWKRCKTNRKLRARIDRLNEHIQQYSDQLSSEHWNASCDELQNTLNTAKTWRILKALINPDSTKTMTTHKINRLTNQHTDPDTLLAAIKGLYVAPACQPRYPNYEGSPHTGLDEEFTYAELRAALRQCKGSKATGPDLVTTALLRNLSDADQDHLLHSINLVWTGKLPLCDLWKKGHMIFIPKPGKPVELQNLRPITLTSHVGKVMERMVLRRLQQHLEDTQALPHCMIGYRSHLSTQDTLLRIHEEILQSPSTAQLRAILAIDLTKAFDYVDHDAMLSELADTQCRLILHELGYTPHPTGPQPTPLDNTILQHITVAPIPRHMDRDRNPTRRLLRAAYYTRKISRDPESHHVFTDAALKDTLGAFAYITSRGTEHSETQRCASPVEAELLAIALAAANNSSPGRTTHIYTDSKSACSHLAQGLAFPSALPLLNNVRGPLHIHWIPGHAGVAGNERAHQLARETLLRAPADACDTAPVPPPPLPTLADLLASRCTFPPPHTQLTRREQTLIRQAQTYTLLTPARLHLFRRSLGDPLPLCSRCLTPSDQDHLLWDCPHNPAQPHTYTREWLALAVSLEQQRELAAHINRALSGCLD